MESQIGEEVERLLRLDQRVYARCRAEPEMKLATRPEEFLGTVDTWTHAEAELTRALEPWASRTRSTRATARSTVRRSTST
jgi:threonyl-tRNA synthetase